MTKPVTLCHPIVMGSELSKSAHVKTKFQELYREHPSGMRSVVRNDTTTYAVVSMELQLRTIWNYV